jgi:hypothetical protein
MHIAIHPTIFIFFLCFRAISWQNLRGVATLFVFSFLKQNHFRPKAIFFHFFSSFKSEWTLLKDQLWPLCVNESTSIYNVLPNNLNLINYILHRIIKLLSLVCFLGQFSHNISRLISGSAFILTVHKTLSDFLLTIRILTAHKSTLHCFNWHRTTSVEVHANT